MDELDLSAGPRLIHWVGRSPMLDMHRWGLITVGQNPGDPVKAGRDTPQGPLSWQILLRDDGLLSCGGALPTLIQWEGRHPAEAMPDSGVVLKSLALRGLREDATLQTCEATVLAVDEAGIVLDRTVFYPQGGGQAGDAGELVSADGHRVSIVDARKHKDRAGDIAHVPAADAPSLRVGDRVTARIDTARRLAHMRFHTATHLLCALVPHPVDGCSITAGYARLDFHMNEPLDKETLTQGIARFVAAAHPVRHRWISEAELDVNPQLVLGFAPLNPS